MLLQRHILLQRRFCFISNDNKVAFNILRISYTRYIFRLLCQILEPDCGSQVEKFAHPWVHYYHHYPQKNCHWHCESQQWNWNENKQHIHGHVIMRQDQIKMTDGGQKHWRGFPDTSTMKYKWLNTLFFSVAVTVHSNSTHAFESLANARTAEWISRTHLMFKK